jgi:hypothetical protein
VCTDDRKLGWEHSGTVVTPETVQLTWVGSVKPLPRTSEVRTAMIPQIAWDSRTCTFDPSYGD